MIGSVHRFARLESLKIEGQELWDLLDKAHPLKNISHLIWLIIKDYILQKKGDEFLALSPAQSLAEVSAAYCNFSDCYHNKLDTVCISA